MRLIVLILFCWTCLGAAPTEFSQTVKEDGTGNFTTLNLWETGCDGDLVTSNVYAVAKIEGSWTNPDTSAVTISGWATSIDCYICVTNSTSKHDGKRYGSPATAYRIEPAADSAPLTIGEEYVRVYGLQCLMTLSGASDKGAIQATTVAAGGSDIIVGYCIVNGAISSTRYGYGFLCYDADATMRIFNSISYGFLNGTYACRGVQCGNGTLTCYNMTLFGNYVGFREAAGTLSTSNCIAQDTDGWSGTIDGDYNCSGNGDAPGANSLAGSVNVVFVNESAGTEDFHLDATDASGVKDATSDLSSGLFADDIDYVTRAGSWCIGADEYVAAATGGQVIIITTH